MTLRRLLPYLSILMILSILYAGWTVWQRRHQAQLAEQQLKEREAARDAQITEKLGGDRLKILMFYVSPTVVPPAGKALVCYGVSNAVRITIEPRIEDVRPSLSRCLEAHPTATTEYKLTAYDNSGRHAEQSVTLTVHK